MVKRYSYPWISFDRDITPSFSRNKNKKVLKIVFSVTKTSAN